MSRNRGLLSPLSAGFTLLELLIALAIIGVMVALVTQALPPTHQRQLQTESERLATLFDLVRSQSAAYKRVYRWQAAQLGYVVQVRKGEQWVTLTEPPLAEHSWPWDANRENFQLNGSTKAEVLFPGEPVTRPMELLLRLGEQQAKISSDGASPFQMELTTLETLP